jgi:hypothetical protein
MVMSAGDSLLISAVDGQVCLTFKDDVVMVLSLVDLKVESEALFYGCFPGGGTKSSKPSG